MESKEKPNDSPAKGGASLEAIPRGIEVLIKKASVDPEFKTLLLIKRSEAAGEIGLELDPAEAAMLSSIPEEQLLAIIDRTTVEPENRRVFLSKSGGLMLAALGGFVVFMQCISLGHQVRGPRPDIINRLRDQRTTDTQKVQPDRPTTDTLENRPDPRTRTLGIQPDRPPKKDK